MAGTQQKEIGTVERPLAASVVIPGSKSISNRVLLLAALAEGVSTLTNLQISDDTLVFVRALQALGFGVEETGDAVCTVTGAGGGAPNASASVWCGSAGTAARFLLASVAAGEGDYHFDSTAQMKRRPMHTLIAALQAQGRRIETIEGLDDALTRAVQDAIVECGGVQCGYCTPGVVVMITALLRRHPDADAALVREALSGNICRCTGYAQIVDAVQRVVASNAGRAT